MSEHELEHDEQKAEAGFEYGGRFYRWTASDTGKDLMLVDHFARGMPVNEFFEVVQDKYERRRGPIILALIATSIRAGNPTWSVERILRLVENLSLGDDIAIVGEDEADEEELEVDVGTDADPPPAGVEETQPEPQPEVSTKPQLVS